MGERLENITNKQDNNERNALRCFNVSGIIALAGFFPSLVYSTVNPDQPIPGILDAMVMGGMLSMICSAGYLLYSDYKTTK